MKVKIDPEKFALAVVSSSSSDLTPAEKLDLYKKAYNLVFLTKP